MKLRPTALLLGACAALVMLPACSSKEGRLQSGLEKSAEFVRLADWEKASIEVRNVLQIDPKNAQAYFVSGQIAEGRRDVQRAFASFNKVLELKPEHVEAKVSVARIYLLAGDPVNASKAVDEVLQRTPQHVGALTLRAAIAARNGQVEAATAQARALIAGQKVAPVDATMLLAGLQANQGDDQAALATIEQGLQGSPQHLSLLRVAAQIAGAASAPAMADKAVAFYKRATEQAPKNLDLWTAWAQHHAQRNQLDAAEEVMRTAVRVQPDDSQRTLAMLNFLSARRGTEVAEKAYLAAIADKPRDSSLRFGLVNLYRQANRPADARRVLQETADIYKNNEAPGLDARNQLAVDAWSRGQASQARSLVGAVLTASPRDAAALVLRGRMLLAEGDARSAILDLRSALKDQPGSAEVAGLLAQAHRKADEPQLAREVLAEAVKLRPALADLRLLLAADLADAKEFRAATAELDAAIKATPEDIRAHDMKARLALAQKNPAAAEKTYVALKELIPGSTIGAMKLGEFYVQQRRTDQALAEFDAAHKVAPDLPGPLLSAVMVLVAGKRYDEADRRVDAVLKRDPKSLVGHQLRSDVALARGDLARAEQAYQQFIALAPAAPAGYHGLARVKAQRGTPADVITVLEQGEKAVPGDLSMIALRAEWLVRAGRPDEAIAVYEGLIKRGSDDDAYVNNLAYLLSESSAEKPQLERALSLLQRFKDSTNPGYLDSLGWTQYRLGQFEDAVATLERAHKLTPDAPLLQLHLGMALHKRGNTARAQAMLEKALASKSTLPHADEARRIVAMR